MISSRPFSVFTSIRTLRQRGRALGILISCPQSKARLDGHPSSRVAAAGNSAFRSGVVVKKIAAMSSTLMLLACVISASSSLAAARMPFLLFAETVIAPLMPRHCNLSSLLFRFKLIAYPNYHPSSRKLGLIARQIAIITPCEQKLTLVLCLTQLMGPGFNDTINRYSFV